MGTDRRRLKISRETVRELTDEAASLAAGATVTITNSNNQQICCANSILNTQCIRPTLVQTRCIPTQPTVGDLACCADTLLCLY